MRGSIHLGLGICTGIVVGSFINYQTNSLPYAICFIYPCMLGSLFPDIDSQTSKLGSKLKISSKIINKIFGHRGVVHTLLCLLFLNIPFVFLKQYLFVNFIYIGFDVGFLLHLLQDSFTKQGIKWFFPLSMKSYSFCKMASGKYKKLEIFFSALIFLGIFFCLYLIEKKLIM